MNEQVKKAVSQIELPPALSDSAKLGIARAVAEIAIKQKQRKSRRNAWLGLIAASMAGILLVSATVWGSEMAAAIQRALQFVPGVGVVEKSNEADRRLVLGEPVQVEMERGSIRITSLTADAAMTYIVMSGDGGSRFGEYVSLLQNGKEHKIQRSMASSGGASWTASYWHNGELALEPGEALLQFQGAGGEWHAVSLMLEQADAYGSYEELGPTVTANGITVTAIVSEAGNRTRVFLTSQHEESFRIDSYGVDGILSKKLSVQDDLGQEYEVERIDGLSAPSNDFYVDLARESGRRYSLTIPEIAVSYEDKARITIDVETRSDLNRTVQLAGHPITVTGTEVVAYDHGGQGLRVYVDTHRNPEAPSRLGMFNLNRRSHMAKLNEEQDTIVFVEFDIEPSDKKVRLTLSRPTVIKRGPWQLELPKL